MQAKSGSTAWIASFKKDELFGHLRFKMLDNGYPRFVIDEDLPIKAQGLIVSHRAVIDVTFV